MKRKRFEKLLMGRHGMSPRAARESTHNLIEARRRAEQVHGNLFLCEKETGMVGRAKFYSYKKMLDLYEHNKPVIGIEGKA